MIVLVSLTLALIDFTNPAGTGTPSSVLRSQRGGLRSWPANGPVEAEPSWMLGLFSSRTAHLLTSVDVVRACSVCMLALARALLGWYAASGLVTWILVLAVYIGVCWAVYASARPRQRAAMTRIDHFRRRRVARYSRKSMVPPTGVDWELMD